MILHFISDLFHQFLILLILDNLLRFIPYDLFHHIIYHQSYPSKLFHHIISQYYLYFSANPIFQFQYFYIIGHSFFIIFTYLISFIIALVIAHINIFSLLKLFFNIVYIFLQTQFYQFQDFDIISNCFLIIFIHLISFIIFILNIVYIFL